MIAKRLMYIDGKAEWVSIEESPMKKLNNPQKEDLTVSGYIDKYGGIESGIDKKVYTTKSSYMEHLKRNDKVIKDW